MNICRASILIAAILLALESTSLAMTAVSLRGASALKLHLYDHCPYCTRVELVLGWHGRRYERAVYGYADVEGPTALTGKKVLPVITWRDEDGMEHTLGESLDIIEASKLVPKVAANTQSIGIHRVISMKNGSQQKPWACYNPCANAHEGVWKLKPANKPGCPGSKHQYLGDSWGTHHGQWHFSYFCVCCTVQLETWREFPSQAHFSRQWKRQQIAGWLAGGLVEKI